MAFTSQHRHDSTMCSNEVCEWYPPQAWRQHRLREWRQRLPKTLLIYASSLLATLFWFWMIFQRFTGAEFPWPIALRAGLFVFGLVACLTLYEGFSLRRGHRMRITKDAVFHYGNQAMAWKYIHGYWFESTPAGYRLLVLSVGKDSTWRLPLPDAVTEATVKHELMKHVREMAPPVELPVPQNALQMQALAVVISTPGGAMLARMMSARTPLTFNGGLLLILAGVLAGGPFFFLLFRQSLGPRGWRECVAAYACSGCIVGMLLGPWVWLIVGS